MLDDQLRWQVRMTLWMLLWLLSTCLASADEIDDSVINIGGCSGVIIARDAELAYGVSAAHCVGSVGGTAQYTTRSGTNGSLRWKVVDRKRDLALFTTYAKYTDGFCQVITPIPEGGDWIGLGYPGKAGGRAARKTLKFTNHVDQMKDRNGRQIVDRNGFEIPRGIFGGGDSGGGVFASSEQKGIRGLVGIISHGNDEDTYMLASSNRALVAFLAENESFMSKQCQNGYCENWRTAPPPPGNDGLSSIIPALPGSSTQTGQHNLPEFMDTDRERGEIILKLIRRLEALELVNRQLQTELEQLASQATTPARPGPAGRDGKPGPAGPQGPAGADAVINTEELIAEVIRRLPQADPVDLDRLASEVKKRLPPIPASFEIRPRTTQGR